MCKQGPSAQTPIIIFIIIIIERRSRAAVTVRLMKAEAQTGGPHPFSQEVFGGEAFKMYLWEHLQQTFSYVAFMANVMLCEGHEAMKPHNSFFF